MNDIPLFKVFMAQEASSLVSETLSSGMITQHKKVEEFEHVLKQYFNHPYVLTVNSATSGLTLAYRLLSYLIDSRDHVKVISTPLTCFATTAAILANHLPIVWADVDPTTCHIDLDDVEKKCTQDTRIVCLVHWGGNPVNLDRVQELKEWYQGVYQKELYVIEDCAHAFGAMFHDKKLGNHGNICVYSTQAIKHLTTGDGGILLLPTKEMYDRAKLLRWYGIDREQKHSGDYRLESDIPEFGYKFHMNDINATIGLANMPYIPNMLETIRENAAFYQQHLKHVDGIELLQEHGHPSFWIYTIKVKRNKSDFIQFMKKHGITTSQVHARNDLHSCVYQYKTYLPQLDELESQIVSIPVGWWVSKKNVKYIVEKIKEFCKLYIHEHIYPLQESERNEYRELLYHLNAYKGREREFSVKGIYVYKIHDQIVASAKLVIETKCYESLGHIEDVITHPDYRHKGYGKQLVQALAKIALKECYKVIVDCKEELTDFYEKCGFSPSGVSMEIRKPLFEK